MLPRTSTRAARLSIGGKMHTDGPPVERTGRLTFVIWTFFGTGIALYGHGMLHVGLKRRANYDRFLLWMVAPNRQIPRRIKPRAGCLQTSAGSAARTI